jgi:molecular chaperone GrpE
VSPDRQTEEQEVVAPEGAAPPSPVAEHEGAVAEAAIAETDGSVEGEALGAGVAAGAGVDAAGDEPEAEPDPEAELREQAGRYLELAQRTQADFDNYRKRMAREMRAAEARGIGKLARELLPALDNLERALAAAEQAEPTHELSEGIRLVTRELSAALGRTGVEGYDPTGQPFDPNQHEAVAQHEVEGTEPGTVVQVLQSGYRLNEAILRPARVIVAS